MSLSCGLGYFASEVEAGIACAKHAINEFGNWAVTSHVLLANFTPSELMRMKDEVDAGMFIIRAKKSLPPGVTYHKRERKYYVRCFGVTVGTYVSKEEAIRVLEEYRMRKHLMEWEAHKKIDITRDESDNSAVIALSGEKGQGAYSKVPDECWHALTFKASWSLCKGYAGGRFRGGTIKLHKAVWSLLHPGYKSVKGFSIDHINPEAILDNRAENLRLASKSDQERNKKNRGITSKYPGVWKRSETSTFCARVIVNGKHHNLSARTEIEAARALNALRVRLLGPNTPLLNIIE
jgi:hypothetical protein